MLLFQILNYARKNNWEIIYTRDTHDAELYPQTSEGKHLPVPHCIKWTDDWQIVKELAPKENDKIIDKETFGYGGWFDGILDRTDEVYVCGTCTDICVVSNSLAIKQGLFNEVNIVEDACAGLSKEGHDAAIKVMKTCHCNITKVNEVITPHHYCTIECYETDCPKHSKEEPECIQDYCDKELGE